MFFLSTSQFGEMIFNLMSIFSVGEMKHQQKMLIESLPFFLKRLVLKKKTHVSNRISLLSSVMKPWLVAMEELVYLVCRRFAIWNHETPYTYHSCEYRDP